MNYAKPEPRWRRWLTPEERTRVDEIDTAGEAFALLQTERRMIANRAIQRARWAEKKDITQ